MTVMKTDPWRYGKAIRLQIRGKPGNAGRLPQIGFQFAAILAVMAVLAIR